MSHAMSEFVDWYGIPNPVGLEKSNSASEPATLGFVVDRHRGGSGAGLALLPTRMMVDLDLEYPQLTVLNPVFEPHRRHSKPLTRQFCAELRGIEPLIPRCQLPASRSAWAICEVSASVRLNLAVYQLDACTALP